MKGIEYIKSYGETMAIIIRNEYSEPGVHFFTDPDSPQQLAFMSHPNGTTLKAHIHNKVERIISTTMETLFIKKGRLDVDFYIPKGGYTGTSILLEGDVIILMSGGHGFHAIGDVEMFEVKQGPYLGINNDKTLLEE